MNERVPVHTVLLGLTCQRWEGGVSPLAFVSHIVQSCDVCARPKLVLWRR